MSFEAKGNISSSHQRYPLFMYQQRLIIWCLLVIHNESKICNVHILPLVKCILDCVTSHLEPCFKRARSPGQHYIKQKAPV